MVTNATPYRYELREVIAALSQMDAYQGLVKPATRYSFAEAILQIGEVNPDVVVLDADVSHSIKTGQFGDRFPDRKFNFGIAEQNTIAAAAGMSTKCTVSSDSGNWEMGSTEPS